MRDTIVLRCGKCGWVATYTVNFIEGVIKGMKIQKRDEVAQQMADKRGPFYDKWLAAMAARGEPKRCRDCFYFEGQPSPKHLKLASCSFYGQNPGQFACKWFKPIEEG